MTREAFRELVKKGPVLLDGATGTNLQKAGMPVGVCPEQWILENSEVLIDHTSTCKNPIIKWI